MSSLSALLVGSVVEAAGQSLLNPGGWVMGPVGTVSPEPIVVAALAVGFVGMSIKSVFDSILSDEETDAGGGDSSEDGLMPEEGGEDFGGLGGLEDDDEGFGEFGDEEFGDMDNGADTDELEHRLDELETEVGSLSSTVNTVRNENEQISETVDDVEENVRKLLDIYEMVTRGVNPFADDIEAGGFAGQGENSFGLFDQGEEETDDELEEDIAQADAEGFFDEDLVEDEAELEADADVGDVLGDEADDESEVDFDEEFDEDFDDALDEDFETAEEAEESGGEGGKSFAELKDEYESGDAEWAEGAEPDDAEESEPSAEEGTDGAAEDAFEEMASEPAEDALADDDLFDTVIDEDDATDADDDLEVAMTEDSETSDDAAHVDDAASDPSEASEEAAETVTDAEAEAGATTASAAERDATESGDGTESHPESAGSDDAKPYLTELPDGFLADLIVVEWLEFLVGEVGVRATSEAIHYYERIDWIDEDVADQLQAYLRGFEADGEPATLTIDHHTKSLRYVSQLNGGGAESIALEQLPATAGGGSDGIQR